jgi:Tol biopolymer transport system component
MAFAPDGKLGLWTSQENGASEFWVIAKPDAAPRAANHMPPGRARMFAWLPDSAHVVFSDGRTLSSGEHLWLAHVATGALHEITTGTGREQAPSAPSASDEIAFASANVSYGIIAVPLNGGAATLDPVRPRPFSDSSPAWSPVAAEYAYVTDRSGQPEIWLKDTHSGWERPIVTPKEFPDRSLFLGDLAFSGDGQRVAYRRQTEKSEAIWVSTLNGEAPLRLAREPGDAFQRGPTWSPDGNWIAYCSMRSGKYALMKAPADGSGAPALIRLDAGVRPAWSPRGDVIATLNGDGIGLVNADGSAARTVGAGRWLTATWSKHGDVLFGLRRSPQQRLELAMLDPRSGNVSVRADLGSWPAAFSYAAAMDLDPIRGASISADGKTLLTSVLNVDSDLWLLSGFKK